MSPETHHKAREGTMTPQEVSGAAQGQERPVLVDLFCGRGGVTRAFLAAGYRVIGVDIVHHQNYPAEAEFILADCSTLDGHQFQGCHVLWASPPCLDFSRHRMPWTRKRATEPDLSLVQAAYKIRDEVVPTFFVLENVREAQRWLGPAMLQRVDRYLWGDILLAPKVKAKAKEAFPGNRSDLRSEVPYDLAYGLALAFAAANWRATDAN